MDQQNGMRRMRAAMVRLAGLFPRRRRERELSAEMDAHLQLHIDDNLRAGMTPQQARRDAVLKLGGLDATKEAWRDQAGVPWLEHLLQDLRYALRQLRKGPAFAATAILMLALGIGASMAIFAFVDAALIQPLPYLDPTRLVHVTESIPMIPRANLSYPDYLDWKRLNQVFRSLDVYTGAGHLLRGPRGVEVVTGERVSDGFFHTLGIRPALGRDFYAGEDLPDKARAVILSYAAWQKRFGGNRDAIGRTVTLDDEAYTIVGVLPREFQFAPAGPAEFWSPLHPAGNCDLRRSCHGLEGVARLRDGVTIQAAFAETRLIAAQLERQYPDSNRGQGASVVPLSEVIVGDLRPVLLVLLTGAGMLLLIAFVNVAGLLSARSDSRRREMALRGALGASISRLVHQFAAESLVLVAAGAALGLVAARYGMQALAGLISKDKMARMPYLGSLGLHLHGLGFACAVSLVAAMVLAATPLVHLSLRDVRAGLNEASRGSAGTTWRRFGARLVVAELAVAMVLLSGTGLLGKSLHRLLNVNLGFQPDALATLEVQAPDKRYAQAEQQVALARRVLSRAAALPGVTSVATASVPPVSFNGNTTWIRFVGRPYHGEHNEVNERQMSSEYFRTIGATLLRGRYFTDAEDASKPGVAIINRALERKYFASEDPIGKQIGDTALSAKSLQQIIGVVDDIKDGPLDSEIWPAIYEPFNQQPDTYFTLVVRTAQSPQSVLAELSRAVRGIDADISTHNEITMSERIAQSPAAWLHRSAAWLVGGFAALALLEGVIGLYGLVAYSVSRRTREIGVRMALGAQPGTVCRLVLAEAFRLAALGIIAGLVCSIAAATLMRNLLFGTPPWDAPTLAAVAVVLAAAALLASYIPARRAASVDPVEALRAE
jgi:predicted permease